MVRITACGALVGILVGTMVSKQIRDRVQLMNYVMNNDSDVGNDNIWSTQDTLTLDVIS